MNKKRNFTIVLFLALLFFFMTGQTEDMTRQENMASDSIHNDPAVQTIVDPMIIAGLADSESQVVSLRTTHELTNSEITYLESQGVIFRRHNGQVAHAGCIYLAEVESSAALSVAHGIGYIEYLEGDNVLNDIHLDQSVPEIGADSTYTLRDPVLSSEYITGSGVTVAIIDSGIDYQHPDFYFADGGEYYYRFDAIGGYYIDLDDDSIYDVGEKSYYYDLPGDGGASSTFDPAYDWQITDTNGNAAYDYGIDGMFVANDINDNGVLDVGETCVMLDTCKIEKIWDQPTGNYYVRGVNLTNPAINTHTDTNGHGTHVAGTVAGGQFGYRTYVGVAPDAEIMMIETTFSSVDIMDAVIWAVNEGADVITMSIGGYIHRPLDGSSNYEQVFDWAYDQGVPSTLSAGNRADDDIHSSVTLPASTESNVRFEVTSSGQSYVYFTTLWRDSSNSLTLRIQPPYALIPSPIFSIPLTGSVVNVENNLVYAYRYTSSRGTAYIALYITYQSPLTSVETGTWTLYVNNPSTSGQFTHTYIYPGGSNKMIDYVDSAYTVGSPATADHAIAVASYVTKLGGSSSTLGDISVFSSIGPRIDGTLKPEIAAPGELIMSAASIDAGGSSGGHVLMQGTSMACPHAAGVLALEVQCHPAGMLFSSSSLRSDLLNSADADSFTGSVPNIIWGYGKIDAFEAVVREWPQVSPVISELTIDDVSFSNQQTIDILRGEPFVLSVLLIEDQSYLDLNVEMEFSALGGPVEGSLPLIYDPALGRWNSTLTFNPTADIDVYNLTIIATDPLFTSDPYTIFVNLLNELPEIHSIKINETSVFRTNPIEFSVNASDYRDLTNLTVTLCLHLPDSSWLNTTMTWNGSLFVKSITFNITDQIGYWDVYVRVADWDDGVVSEFYGNFLILNNDPTVSGSLVSSTVGIGTSMEVDVTCDDIEDGWNGLTVMICLQDSGNDWSNFTVVITSGIDTVSVDTTGLYPGYYEVYVVVVDQDGAKDESYCGTVELVDADLPTIDSPLDITYDEFTTGHTITWSPEDLHPQNYTIFLESVEVKSGAWNSTGETITISVDGHGLGTFNYTIVVTDVGSNIAIDTVLVTVIDGTPPVLVPSPDIQYDEFDTGFSISWSPSDAHPVSYTIFLHGLEVRSGAWNSTGETITISVDGHEVGVFNYTLVVTDIGVHTAMDTVLVTVADGTSPILDSPPDVQYKEFDTGLSISWIPSDVHPVSYVILLDGLEVRSGAWNSTGETITISVDGHGLGTFNYTIVVTDIGDKIAQDEVMVTVTDGTDPTLDYPDDIQYSEFETGYSVSWTPSDLHPQSYVVYLDGSPLKSGAWNSTGESITISVDGHGLGTFNYTIVVTDIGDNTAHDEVMVTVTDGTGPALDNPDDIEYPEFETGHFVSWSPSDLHPQSYVVYLDGSPLKSGAWNSSGEIITISVDGHGLGTFNYTITVFDEGSNPAFDTVFVTVIDGTPPTINSPVDIEYVEHETGYEIVWTPNDLHPLSYEILRDGSVLVSEDWNSTTGPIPISVDGLSPDVYNYTIIVMDVGGSIAVDVVIVTVIGPSTTIFTTTTQTTTQSTTVTTTISLTSTTTEQTTPTSTSSTPTTTSTVTTDTTTEPTTSTTTSSIGPGDGSVLILIVIAGAGGIIVVIVVIIILQKKR